MRVRVERVGRGERWPRVPAACAVCVALWVLMVSWLAFGAGGGEAGSAGWSTCVVRGVTGVPCPTCGGTRGVRALVSGDVAGAVAWNPLVMATLAVGAVVLGARLGLGLLVRVESSRRARGVLLAAAAAVIAANWAYVVWSQGVGGVGSGAVEAAR